jgi:flagellin-like hook-associated protein FlgL
MRITHKILAANFLANLQRVMGQLAVLQGHMSSGKRVERPSDDPVAVGQLVRLAEGLDAQGQYLRNAGAMQAWVTASETFLRAGQESLQEARELAVRGANSTLAPADRKAIAEEVEARLRALLDAGNGEQAGRYLFAGYRIRQRPFAAALNEAGRVEKVCYVGDQGAMVGARSAGSTLAYNVTGLEGFAWRTHTLVGNAAGLGAYSSGTFYVNGAKVTAEAGLTMGGLASLINAAAGEQVRARVDGDGRLRIESRDCSGWVVLAAGTSDVLQAAGMADAAGNVVAEQWAPLNAVAALLELRRALTEEGSRLGVASVTGHSGGGIDAIAGVRNFGATNSFALMMEFDGSGNVVAGSVGYFPVSTAGPLTAEQQAQLEAANAGGRLNAESFSAFGIELALNGSPSRAGWQVVSVEGPVPQAGAREISLPAARLAAPGCGITSVWGEAAKAAEYQLRVEHVEFGGVEVGGAGAIVGAVNGAGGTGWQNAGEFVVEVAGGQVQSLRFRPAVFGGRALTSSEVESIEAVNQTHPALTADLLSSLGIELVLGAPSDGTQTLAVSPTTARVSVVARDPATGAETRTEGSLYANSSAATAKPPLPGVTISAGDLRPGTAVVVARALLQEIDLAFEQMGTTIGRVGALSQGLQRSVSDLEQQEVTLRGLQSELGDVDLTRAVVDLQRFEIIYQAALAAGARLLPGSLLDYLT